MCNVVLVLRMAISVLPEMSSTFDDPYSCTTEILILADKKTSAL